MDELYSLEEFARLAGFANGEPPSAELLVHAED